ncbi:hypothetical protein FACS189430_03930 [Bacteroidia bacterium]|nr:hypothetical protein FACS189430_03930 [Bacteroidia bacterium]
MSKKTIFSVMLILSAILASCGGDSATQQVVKQLHSSYDLDGQEVQLVGYVAIASGKGGGALIMNNQISVGLVNSNWQQKQDAFASANINFGQNPNCLYLPEKFQLGDVEIYDSNGQKYDVNTKFTFKAKVKYTRKDWEKETVADETDKPKMQIHGVKTPAQRAEEAKKAAEERKKATGDPNDYSFKLTVVEISVAK